LDGGIEANPWLRAGAAEKQIPMDFLDRVFEDVANDLVVPEPGVYGANGTASFSIPEARLLKAPATAGIIHTMIFGYPPSATNLLEWLA
jgi:hypothetical protein